MWTPIRLSLIHISSKEDLDKVRLNLDAHYYQTADITFTEADFAAGGAFYNDGKGFEPIGNMNEFFTGEYYGEDHSIYNLYINRNDDLSLIHIFCKY